MAISCVYAYDDNEKIGCVVYNEGRSRTRSYNTFYIPSGANNVSVDLCAFNANYAEIDITPSDFIWGQIERGSKVTNYEPYHAPITTSIYLPEQIKMVGDEAEYIDYEEQKQHRVRKNLLKHTYASSGTLIYDGVSIRNDDGVLTLNGTSINGSYITIATDIKLPIGTYILTGASENLILRFQKTSTGYGYDDNGDGRNINCLEEVTNGICSMKLTANYTYDNVEVYPMICKANIEDDTYEPYIENTDLDITFPALSTIKGINTFSVKTLIQPSNI